MRSATTRPSCDDDDGDDGDDDDGDDSISFSCNSSTQSSFRLVAAKVVVDAMFACRDQIFEAVDVVALDEASSLVLCHKTLLADVNRRRPQLSPTTQRLS